VQPSYIGIPISALQPIAGHESPRLKQDGSGIKLQPVVLTAIKAASKDNFLIVEPPENINCTTGRVYTQPNNSTPRQTLCKRNVCKIFNFDVAKNHHAIGKGGRVDCQQVR
jgi:hypothetical protein